MITAKKMGEALESLPNEIKRQPIVVTEWEADLYKKHLGFDPRERNDYIVLNRVG